MKILKRIFLALVVLGLVAVLVTAFYFGRIVQHAVQTFGPKITGTSVKIAGIRCFPGSIQINGLEIGNPPGYTTPFALRFDELKIDASLSGLTRNPLLLREVRIVAPEVYMETKEGQSNLEKIQQHALRVTARREKPDPNGKGANKKVIVNRLTVEGAKLHVKAALLGGNNVTLPVPDIELRDLGKGTSGLTIAEVTSTVLGQMLNGVGRALQGMGANVGTGIGNLGSKLKGIFGGSR